MLDLKNSPIGSLVPTIDQQLAFVPADVPVELALSPELYSHLDSATLAIGTLAGVGESLRNPNLLMAPFLRREAVLSSRIEGTEASISDVFMYEASGRGEESADVREVINYVHALNHGLARLSELPICGRLTNEMHAILTEGVRGGDKRPGEIRADQDWIGTRGTLIGEAHYIPPPPHLVPDLLHRWEQFVNSPSAMPLLVKCALMHYQFEAIHPYLDGNGRIGRALIVLFLCQEKILRTPLLYLSAYFDTHRGEYVDHLYSVSATGRWEPWIEFFLTGVTQQAQDALQRSRHLRDLEEEWRTVLHKAKASANALRLLEAIFVNPYVTAPRVVNVLGVTNAGAQGVIDRLEQAGILEYASGRWPRVYVARRLLQILEAPTA